MQGMMLWLASTHSWSILCRKWCYGLPPHTREVFYAGNDAIACLHTLLKYFMQGMMLWLASTHSWSILCREWCYGLPPHTPEVFYAGNDAMACLHTLLLVSALLLLLVGSALSGAICNEEGKIWRRGRFREEDLQRVILFVFILFSLVTGMPIDSTSIRVDLQRIHLWSSLVCTSKTT